MKTISINLPENFFQSYITNRGHIGWVKTLKTDADKFAKLVADFRKEAGAVGHYISLEVAKVELHATQQDFDMIKTYYEDCKALDGYEWLRHAANPMCMGTRWLDRNCKTTFVKYKGFVGPTVILISPNGDSMEFDYFGDLTMERETKKYSSGGPFSRNYPRFFYDTDFNPYTAAIAAYAVHGNPSLERMNNKGGVEIEKCEATADIAW